MRARDMKYDTDSLIKREMFKIDKLFDQLMDELPEYNESYKKEVLLKELREMRKSLE